MDELLHNVADIIAAIKLGPESIGFFCRGINSDPFFRFILPASGLIFVDSVKTYELSSEVHRAEAPILPSVKVPV